MKYKVMAIYPNMKWERITEHDNEAELYDYLGGLRLCNTPYVALNGDKVLEYSCGDMSKEEMLKYIIKNN